MDRRELRRAWDELAEPYASSRRADGDNAALIDELLESIPPDATVLDVGCGDGRRTLAIFHVPRAEHPAVYAEFARVLRPGGRLLATGSSGRYETVRDDWLGSDQAMFFSTPGPRRTRKALERAGFGLDRERTVDDPLGSSVPFVMATYRGE